MYIDNLQAKMKGCEMSRVKHGHYVPQSYLKRFANEKDQICVWDKSLCKSFPSHIKGVANDGPFYDFSLDIQQRIAARLAAVPEDELSAEAKLRLLDPQVIEKDLARIESEFKAVLDEVLQTVDATGEFTQDQKERMAGFLVLQLTRSPEFRTTELERMRKVIDSVSRKMLAIRFGEAAVADIHASLDIEDDAYLHARMMYDPKMNYTLTETLLSHIWHIGVNRTERPLYTSDNPVIVRSHLNQEAYGIGSPGVEINFPLDPWHMLVLVERSQFSLSAHVDKKTLLLNVDNVDYFNSGQVLDSFRQVYSSSFRFDLAADLCAMYPDIRNPHRDRIKVIGGL